MNTTKEINDLTVKDIKDLGKERSAANLSLLLDYFNNSDNINIDIRREIVSSIGRQEELDTIYDFINREAFNNQNPMELIYQMYRTCLYKQKKDPRFERLGNKLLDHFKNEMLYKMKEYYDYRQEGNKHKQRKIIQQPLLLEGDAKNTLQQLPEESVQLVFTSPPYYNAREYSDYKSYQDYLDTMQEIFAECCRVLEDGRFIIVNISPVITKRPGRRFTSIRYPIPYDYHKILSDSGFEFVDEIIWIKPEPSVPKRIKGYQQTRKPLTYKPNCITETLMVYRKKSDFLLDKNVDSYSEYDRYDDEEIDTTNCWYITPTSDQEHPAVFPEELCRKVLKYYSFKNDVVLDPFAGSGTFGWVAKRMGRIPVLCEQNEDYIKTIQKRTPNYYQSMSDIQKEE